MGAAEPAETKPAKLKISGYGFIGDLRLKKTLRVLREGKTPPTVFEASYIEDVALLLESQLKKDGYLRPVITARMTLQDGRKISYVWNGADETLLPRPLAVRAVNFKIKKGVLYHFGDFQISGLHAIPLKQARSYFIETGGILALKQNRIYSPDQFKRGIANLTDVLQRKGYQDATVKADPVQINHRTGRVDVWLEIEEGRQYLVRSVRQEVYFDASTDPVDVRTNRPFKAYSKIWEQDFAQGIRTNFYRRGYPDTTIDLQTVGQTTVSNIVLLDMTANVKTGPRIRLGDVSFTGNQRTRESLLERRVDLREGGWLNRLKTEEGRYRLSRLGVFDSVNLKYEKVDEQTRNVTYDLKEGKRIDISLLLGWGSYEMLRGGVQIEQYNLFGLAHHQQLKLTESFKSTSADYTYTVPEPFGENVDMFFNASGLQREEISFTRLEYGGSVGLRKYFKKSNTDVSTRYSYQILEANNVDSSLTANGPQDSRAAAIITDLNHDQRDNPLYPHRGYKIFNTIELASDYLGGDVSYQRIDLAASLHVPISGSQWLHLGLSHGVISTLGGTSEELPFNRRFFPGGENSVRGYKEGEAAPRDPQGNVIGAETYLLGNFEFEQGLTPKWSIVGFVDAVGFAARLNNYPEDQTLVSVGGGLRWKTFIGPVRLEYGYNLNPRPHDPIGTLQFSLGFPF